MNGVRLTAAQAAAAAVDETLADTCVVAGPGSGKTTVLIERFRRLVESGVSPLRILAITFTEKATAEVRQRLLGAFSGDGRVRREIERAPVSTVHGFCARLLKENAIAAGVDPEFRLLGEQESLALERTAAADALDAYYQEHPKAVRSLLAALAAPDLADALVGVYQAMRAAGATVKELRAGAPRPDAGAALERLAGACSAALAERPAGWSLSQTAALGSFRDWADGVVALQSRPLAAGHFVALSRFKLKGLKQGNRLYSLIKEIRDHLLPETLGELAAAYYSPQLETLLAALERFGELHRSRKRSAGALDFSDLEEFAVRLLEENREVRDRIRGQFDQILMDEFQDTNGLQSRLLGLLRSPDRFYAVGDINQSIYGFRHAEPEVFRAYRERVRSEGKRLRELNENFRSRPEILLAVEAVTGGAPGLEPRVLSAGRQFEPKGQPSVEVISCLGRDAEEASRLEALWVARRIVELRRELGAAPRDFALLFRSSTQMGGFARALEDAGIPFVVAAGKGFYEAREITDLTSLLRIIANPLDEIALAAVLRSPLCGASDETLLRMREAKNLSQALEWAPEFAALLRELRKTRNHTPADLLLMRAMDEAGYEAGLPPRARANVEKFLALVREGTRRRTLDEFLDELSVLRKADPRESDSAGTEAADAVKLQTIHSAKGLEFPIVFLPSLQAAVKSDSSAVAFLPEPAAGERAVHGLGVKWRHPGGGSVEDSRFRAVSAEIRRKSAEEADRLLYVAMTRAEQHLVLSCSSSGRPYGNWAKYVSDKLTLSLLTPRENPGEERCYTADGREFAVRVVVTARAPEPAAAEAPAAIPPRAEAPVWLAAPAGAGQYDSSASVTSVALFEDCPRRYYLERYLGWSSGPPAPSFEEEAGPEPDALDAAELGTQVHALLAGTAVERPDPEAERLADRFRSSELGRRAAATLLAEREFDFEMAVEDVVLRGQIDLWFEDAGELVLVDYKTGFGPDARREAHYSLQVQLYAAALEKLLGRKPDRAFLFFLREGRAVEVAVGQDALREARAAVRRLREAQETLQFPLHEGERCRRCPFYRGACPAYSSGFSSRKGSG